MNDEVQKRRRVWFYVVTLSTGNAIATANGTFKQSLGSTPALRYLKSVAAAKLQLMATSAHPWPNASVLFYRCDPNETDIEQAATYVPPPGGAVWKDDAAAEALAPDDEPDEVE